MFRRSAAPVVSELAKLRTRQLHELVKLNPTAVLQPNPIPNDATATYTLQVKTHTIGIININVILGPLFPERPPVCQVTCANSVHRLAHPYLDAHGYLSLHPKLNQAHWSPHQNLGQLIQDLARELIQSPPQIVGAATPAFSAVNQTPMQQQQQQQQQSPYQQAPYQGYALPQSSPQQQAPPQPQQPQPQQQPSPANSVPPATPRSAVAGHSPSPSSSSVSSSSSSSLPRSRPPAVPQSFPSLDAFSIAQLEDLLSGTPDQQRDALRDLASDQNESRQLHEVLDGMCTKLKSSSEMNLKYRIELENLELQVQIKSNKLKQQQQVYQTLLQRQQASSQRYALGSIMSQLDASISSIDQQSETTKEKYESLQLKGDNVNDQGTLEAYIKERMILHERAGKKERLVEMYGRA